VLTLLTFDPVTIARFLLTAFLLYSFVDFAFIRTIDKGNRTLG